jgi:hypothetical protein
MSEPAVWIKQLSTSKGTAFPGSGCGDKDCAFCRQVEALLMWPWGDPGREAQS